MDFSKIGIFSLLKQKMDFIGQRHALISKNIANADTPHYKAEEMKGIDFGKMVGSASGKLEMAVTNPLHMASQPSGGKFATKREKGWDTSPNGNNVVVEEQMQKLSQNSTDYRIATNIYRKTADLFKLAEGNKS